ncbi:MAG: restriction endonuclease [Microbacteriaceae bacterium]|nr:restriction endonuclease [Microbacteriaceae bacterium]
MPIEVPKYSELFLPTMRALRALGGSGSISEIVEKVIQLEAFSEEQQSVLHRGGPESKIGYRIAWARTYLKYFGFVTNSERGVWSLTEAGDRFLEDGAATDADREEALRRLRAAKVREAAEARAIRSIDQERSSTEAEQGEEAEEDLEEPTELTGASWKQRLIATLTSSNFSPAQFERLTQRLLREADFESVEVTGGTGDQGIDGVGVYRLGLLTFPVYFQCKRYSGSVGAGAVRDFRGAMQGRGEKGLLITTGAFTSAAREEANRAGATPIDLIDGDRLCDLLKSFRLGVTSELVEQVTVSSGFFREI